jgi:uncharacterized protein
LEARRHRLSSAQLAEIAWGRPSPQVIRELYAADDSRQRLLAAEALRRSGRVEPPVLDALSVLEAAQRRDEQVVTRLMRAGWLGTLAVSLLDDPDSAYQVANRLGTLAAVAALRTGMDAWLAVEVADGELHLPGTGTLTVTGAPSSTAVLAVQDGHLDVAVAGHRLRLPTAPTPDWSPVRAVHVDGLHVLIDDQHPGRDCFEQPLAGRLSETAFRRWRRVITASWRLLCEVAPDAARQVAHGVRVVVPLASTSGGMDTSVSCRDALGAFATTAPASPVDFAVTMVHEWSHSLLNGMLGFVNLHEPTASPTSHSVAWRPDLRPIGGVIHGTFGFLAVAEAWRALLTHDGAREQAAAELARRRRQLGEVLTTLPAAPELTDQGRRFVAVLRQRHAALTDL